MHTSHETFINGISNRKIDFYYFGYKGLLSSSYRYTHNVPADMSFGLLRVFHIEFGNPRNV